jgi:hypothetical protein
MAKTTVVHCKKSDYDVLIDRTTIFGNPFKIGYGCTREQSIRHFKHWFLEMMYSESEPDFCEAVMSLKGKTLGCWCKPKACHGDVIVAYLEGDGNE